MSDINAVLRMHFVRALIDNVCGDNFEIIKRPASFIFKNRVEDTRGVKRIILLPPKGYTADAFNQTNSHDEAEKATIKINGGVRIDKNGFSKLKKCVLVASFNKESLTSDLDKPYLKFDLEKKPPGLITEIHSAGEAPFSVVKPNGEGFYHNIINLSGDWLVLTLDKKLRPQRGVDLHSALKGFPEEQARILQLFYGQVLKLGDGIFKKAPDIINQVVNMNLDCSLPALAEMLHVYDSGRHEACSVFAVILKIGKMYPDRILDFLNHAIKNEAVPVFYAEQLIEKIRNFKTDFGFNQNTL